MPATAGQPAPATRPRSSSSTPPARWTAPRRSPRPSRPRRWRSTQIVDGTWFAVIARHRRAGCAFPYPQRRPRWCRMDAGARAEAKRGRRPAAAGGGTAIGHVAAPGRRDLFAEVPPADAAPRHPAHRRQERGRAARSRSTTAIAHGTGHVPVRLPRRRRRLGGRRAARDRHRAARHRRPHRRARRHRRGLPGDDARPSMGRGVADADAARLGAAGRAGAVRPPGRARRSRTSPAAARRSTPSPATTPPARGATSPATTTSPSGCRQAGRRGAARRPGPDRGRATQVVAPGAGQGAVVRRRRADHADQPRGRALHRARPSSRRPSRRAWPPRPPATTATATVKLGPRGAARRGDRQRGGHDAGCARSSTIDDATRAPCACKRDVDKLDEMALDTALDQDAPRVRGV